MTACTGIILLPTNHRHLPKVPLNLFMGTPCPPIGNLGSGWVTASVVSCRRSRFVYTKSICLSAYIRFLDLTSAFLSSILRYMLPPSLLFPCSPSSCHRRDVMLCFLVSSCFALISICSFLLSFLVQLIRKFNSLKVPAEGI